MSEEDVRKIAESAAFIVKGYAFTPRENGFVSILNLEHPECAVEIFSVVDVSLRAQPV